ncbi:MAG: phosphatase PAP2 family protein [Streptosporangiaceae bacterium]
MREPRPEQAGEAARASAPVGTPGPPRPPSPVGPAAVSIAAGLAFAGLTGYVAAKGTAVPWVDEHIHRWVIADRSGGSAAIARAVTWGGVTTVALPVLIGVGAAAAGAGRDLSRRLWSGVVLACVAGAGVYVSTRIGWAVGRARPPVADWAGAAGGPSFPSIHTTVATLFAASCAWAIAARVRPGWPRRGTWAAAAGYAATVGWSRIWLGVHWPSDVVGGWLFGLTWSAGSIAVILILRRQSDDRGAAGLAAGSPAAPQDDSLVVGTDSADSGS